ncbi:NUDIX domain-containing protein [Thalassobius sp. Cn5-15]|uniref:NUDIX domain-containing protein n=1 Tax=Thalassobius sp. Cn5-15 TaxID=2917763 RepID=UPI001EF234F4|nr:NUDIX hydrolase [Thalassobius sp. Cn5-15]MCG7494842.1 NUDIX hydrolase [Thalassobius sp. Cn5-15]
MQAGWDQADTVFKGTNVILFIGDRLTVMLRDDKPDIAWPNHWDLPGGLREQGESPVACGIREVREEVAIQVQPSDLIWARCFPREGELPTWFFAAHLAESCAADLSLGDEGQALERWPADQFLHHPQAIPHFRDRLRIYMEHRLTKAAG